MKENRYFQMVYLLLERGSMTAPELAEYFEVSVRTIYRDIDILSAAGKENFQKLQRAILESRLVSFLYCNGKGEKVGRVVEPLKLVFKSTDWYLYGYCAVRSDFRFFKLTRIRNLAVTEEHYSRPIPDQLFAETENFEMETIQVTLLFDKSMSFRVYDRFDDEVTENRDGSLLVETVMPNNELLFRYILSCGDQVEVIQPQSVRDIIAERAKRMAEKYET